MSPQGVATFELAESAREFDTPEFTVPGGRGSCRAAHRYQESGSAGASPSQLPDVLS